MKRLLVEEDLGAPALSLESRGLLREVSEVHGSRVVKQYLLYYVILLYYLLHASLHRFLVLFGWVFSHMLRRVSHIQAQLRLRDGLRASVKKTFNPLGHVQIPPQV
jgi:hypothetical protein